jgi:tetratricopeptide (TPR) repeat protein
MPRRRSRALAAALALGLAASAAAQPEAPAAPPAAPAAPPSPEHKQRAVARLAAGDEALARGDKLMRRGQMAEALEAYELALAAYEAAYAEVANAQIFFAIGQAEQKLGRFVDALSHYERLLVEAVDPPEQLRNQARVAIEAVRKNLGGLELVVTPPGASVRIDGARAGKAPLPRRRYLEPGQHTIAVSAEGHRPATRQVELAAGRLTIERIDLRPGPSGVDDGRPRPIVDTELTPPSHVALYALIGTTSALAIGGTVTALLAHHKHARYENEDLTTNQREAARSSGRTYAIATDVLLGGALIGAVGTILYWRMVDRPRHEAYERAAWIAPYAEPGGGGLALGGGW